VEEVLMRSGRSEQARGAYAARRSWPVWNLPGWLTKYVVTVVALYLAVILTAAAKGSHLGPHGLIVLVALLACSAATVELTKREGESAGHAIDVHAVWELPIAILLPPLYALVAPAFRCILTQWRVRQAPLYRRVFTAAVTGLSYAIASVVFHIFTGTGIAMTVSPVAHPSVWVLAVAGAGILRWLSEVALLMPAVKGADPTVSVRRLLVSRETVHNDVTEFCVAVLVTAGIAVSPLTILFALPFVTLLQRSFRHAYLVKASRIDSKTGLLNAGTWEREAGSEVARAVRTRTPLAVALIDVDHFKAVNDAHGHLVGDKALSAVAETLTGFVREYDLVGRFGGEEFALLLPQTKAVDAYNIAERMRACIASMPIPAAGGEPFKISVSIGVAALGARWDTGTGSQLTDLLAAADNALYQAKQSGRDQVCVITENATFGAHRPGGQGPLRLPQQPGPGSGLAEPALSEHRSLPSPLGQEAPGGPAGEGPAER
jgi:diguanylate cyclase (GGDEF)-like protein